MAKGKKSFVLYTDQIGIFSKLTDEQAGLLIKHIYAYCNDEEPKGDFVTELAFESIKQALKRDLRKFEDVKVKRSEAGKKSAGKTATRKKPALPTGLTANAFLKAMNSKTKDMKLDAKTKKMLKTLLDETKELVDM